MSHLTLTQALIQAEAAARSTLPPELHERLSCAVALVKDGRVFESSDGSWQVGSTSTIGKTYRVNGQCDCDDSHYNHPPQGLCKHRLAMFVSQRVRSLMTQPPAPVVPAPSQMAQEPLALPQTTGDTAPTAPLPEAPVSITLKATLHGYETLVTMRGHDFASVQVQVEAAVQWLQAQAPAGQSGPTASAPQGEGAAHQCPLHHVPMKLNHDKHGLTWLSHKTSEGWCKGRG